MRRLGDHLPAAARAEIARSLALLAEGDAAAALAAIELVTRDLPDSTLPSHLIGLLSMRMAEPGKALKAFTLAHQLAPEVREHAEALGVLHAHLGRVVDSLYFGKLALAATAEYAIPGLLPDWLGSFGDAFFHMTERPLLTEAEARLAAGDAAGAADLFRKATEVEPEAPAAWRGYARALLRDGLAFEAAVAAETMLALPGRTAGDLSLAAEALAACGRFDAAAALHRQAIAAAPHDAAIVFGLIRTLARRGAPDDRLLADEAAAFARRFAPRAERPARPAAAELASRRMRLAVVAGNWGNGDGLDLVVPVIEQCDRRMVELFVYADEPGEAPLARLLRGRADHWQDIGEMDDDTLAVVMANDAPDILIDLDGPTRCTRPLLYLARPAPLTVTLYGVPGAAASLGFDAVLAGFEAWPGAANVLRVPGGIVALPPALPQTGPADRFAEGPPVFGTLSPWHTVAGPEAELWRGILKSVPRSRMLLHPRTLGGAEAAAAARAAIGAGLEPGTVSIADASLSGTDYLERIDLLLESPDNPFPDGSVAALGMGVPVLTHCGRQPRGTMLADFLCRTGLGDVVGADAAAISAAARRLADPERRAELRQRLAAARTAERADGARLTAVRMLETLARALVAG
jgi:Tfp pilus assembly protein PilF